MLMSGAGVPSADGSTDGGAGQDDSAVSDHFSFLNQSVQSGANHDQDVDRFMASQALRNGIDGVSHGRSPTGDQMMAGRLLELWGERAVSSGEATGAETRMSAARVM